MKITQQDFEKLVLDALAEIPLRFRRHLKNVGVTVEWEPNLQLRRELEMRPGDELYGLYQGLPYTHRGADYGNVLPDKITIYQKPLLEFCRNRHGLEAEIRKVLWHEVGHYFGLDEGELRRLEHERRRNASPPRRKRK